MTEQLDKTRELFVVPGEYDGHAEASVKVLARDIVGDAASESRIALRVRVRVVDDHVVLSIARDDSDDLEVLVRL